MQYEAGKTMYVDQGTFWHMNNVTNDPAVSITCLHFEPTAKVSQQVLCSWDIFFAMSWPKRPLLRHRDRDMEKVPSGRFLAAKTVKRGATIWAGSRWILKFGRTGCYLKIGECGKYCRKVNTKSEVVTKVNVSITIGVMDHGMGSGLSIGS